MKRILTLLLLAAFSPLFLRAQTDPLPSWNKDALKKSLILLIQNAAREGSSGYIPKADRIAVSDNDGTLWSEKPLVEGMFMVFRAQQMTRKNPALKKEEPYRSIAAGHFSVLDTLPEKMLLRLFLATHSNLTAAQFNEEARLFFAKAITANGRPVRSLIYKPQLELLRYLKENGFSVFICSGGDVDFMRAISMPFYGIPPEHVIGSANKYEYRDSAGINDLYRAPSDIYMLRYSQGGRYPSFQLLVNHDDPVREAAYSEADNRSMEWAAKYGWHVVSMKNNWKTIFGP